MPGGRGAQAVVIGPEDVLKHAGVPVRLHAPEVGGNLQDHYQARVIVRLRKRMSLNDDVRNPLQLMQMGAQWLFQQRGPLTISADQVGGMIRTPVARDERANVLLNVMPLSVDKPGDPLHSFWGFWPRPRSAGRIRAAAWPSPVPTHWPRRTSTRATSRRPTT